jgi:transcriptional regulator with XRE-family HTH domain
MKVEQVRRILRDRIRGEVKTQKDLAVRIGISPSYLNGVMKGKREPAGKLLDFLRLERVVSYRRAKR